MKTEYEKAMDAQEPALWVVDAVKAALTEGKQ